MIKKKTYTYSIKETTIKALRKEAAKLSRTQPHRISASGLVDQLVEKYVMKKKNIDFLV